MKTLKKRNTLWLRNALWVAVFLSGIGAANADPNQGQDAGRPKWTDRAVTNPPLAASPSLDKSLEDFWNLPETHEKSVASSGDLTRQRVSEESQDLRLNAVLKQSRETRGRRGFIGINLFNLIPLIDIVHGEVVDDSSDHVERRK